jgi:hexosaminidase
MYAEAGLKLTVFHIGGDEVPRGSWEGSVIARDFMKVQGMAEIRDLKGDRHGLFQYIIPA